MKSQFHIQVDKDSGKLLNTREAATELFNKIISQKIKYIEFDFSKVEFMSRSFADQFHKEKLKYQKKREVVVKITNANEEVVKILSVVAKTQNKVNREYRVLPIFYYSDSELLKEYLLSV